MKKGTCRHFNGSWHNKTCEVGVCYRELVGGPDLGWVTRLPCHKNLFEPKSGEKAVCEKYEEPSDQEVAESEAGIKAEFARFEKILPLIAAMKKQFKGTSGAKQVECPICKGVLSMAISGVNGHVWGRCSAEGCLSWME